MGSREMAVTARDFVTMHHYGVLSTLAREGSSGGIAGYPFGSLICYDIGEHAELVISISQISEHYKNLSADPRASVTVLDAFGGLDPQAHPRATLLLELRKVSEKMTSRYEERYFARFPRSEARELAHDFSFFSGTPSRIRWIGGFGDIGWISGEDFAAIEPDPLAYCGMAIVQHMNFDHYPALVDLVRGTSTFDPSRYRLQMSTISSQGFTLLLSSEEGEESLQFSFEQPAVTGEQARKQIIRLLERARRAIQ